MGYCFSVETANAVAQLTEGNVDSCFFQLISNEKMLSDFKLSLERFNDNIYTSERRGGDYQSVVEELLKGLDDYYESRKYKDESTAKRDDIRTLMEVHKGLEKLSELFSQNRYKALLLPQVVRSKKKRGLRSEDDFFIRRDLLKKTCRNTPRRILSDTTAGADTEEL